MDIPAKVMTVEEFDQICAQNPERLFELIDGEIVEKMPTQEHGAIAIALGSYLFFYAKAHNLGIVSTETRHQVTEDDRNALIPDISFMSNSHELPLVKEGSVPQMPDLAVEIKSPGDTYLHMREKAVYYLAHGTRLVWLVYPDKKLVEVYQQGADSDFFTLEDTLPGGEVLPGFTLPVRNIFNI